MQYNYRSRYLVTIENEQSIVNVHKHKKCKLEEVFLVLKPSKNLSMFVGQNYLCRMTEVSGVCDSSDFVGNTILVVRDDMG